ncbi:MAG: molybdopterin molybdotransferase MoeA [Planctomycetota bacterium]|nr:molybdopterin molybdotransferase MoeA [Planctomycetota bacterium]
MISLEVARDRILAKLQPLPAEVVPLLRALDRFTAHDIAAGRSVPPFDNSAFDGYAVRSRDLTAAVPGAPIRLRIAGTAAAGSAPADPFPEGTCFRIYTGAPMPAGADAVVMQEDTRAEGPDTILLETPIRPWEGVRFLGEDVRAGTRLVSAGQQLGPTQLSLLAMTGLNRVEVHRAPRVFVLSTGSELIEPGSEPLPGQIHDSNGILMEALVARAGAVVAGRSRVTDDPESTFTALADAACGTDVLVTTGGVSVGDADLLRPAVERLGGSIDFWRIAMKPGKPFVFGRLFDAWWFGLPGNPVSAFVTWWQLVRPALHRLAGGTSVPSRTVPGRLAQSISNRGDRRHFLRVTLGEDGLVTQSGTQASHVQSSLALANALLDVPERTTWEAGRDVHVERIDV